MMGMLGSLSPPNSRIQQLSDVPSINEILSARDEFRKTALYSAAFNGNDQII